MNFLVFLRYLLIYKHKTMKKSTIKAKLREALAIPVKEEAQGGGTKHKMDYSEIQRKLDGTLLKASQVMSAAGLGNPDDATARSLFSKKLRQETNDEGGVYSFDEKELASIIKVINNPTSYLGAKK